MTALIDTFSSTVLCGLLKPNTFFFFSRRIRPRGARLLAPRAPRPILNLPARAGLPLLHILASTGRVLLHQRGVVLPQRRGLLGLDGRLPDVRGLLHDVLLGGYDRLLRY